VSSGPIRDDFLQSILKEDAEELYESAPCGYLSTLPNGVIVRANATLASWLGFGQDELTSGKRFLDLLTTGGKIFYETHFALLMRMHGHVSGIALDFQSKDGRLIPSLVNAVQKRDVAGRPIVNRITVFDTTERRKYEQELLLARRRAEETATELAKANSELARSNAALLRANQELSEFTHAASHDLQEPLRTMTSYAQLLTRSCEGVLDEDALSFIAAIVEGSRRMQALISDLLSFSQAQGSDLVLRRTDLAEPLGFAISNLHSAIEESGAIISHEALPSLVVDAARMTQLFQNLIGNAIKYRKQDEAPQIHISCTTGQHECTVSIQDNGIGFEAEYSEQVFGMFNRLHGWEIPGTGLGLAICRKIVNLHGGRIWAESTPDLGSTFSFTIPVLPSE
jgi:sigma-B regulation protein RsbU (phosphoserine phosphatase)